MTCSPLFRTVSALALAAALAACDASVVATATSAGTGAGTQPAASARPGAQPGGPDRMQPPLAMPGGPGMPGDPGGGIAGYLAQLDLTADQQAQLDDISARYQPAFAGPPAPPPAAGAAPVDTVSLLTAATLDEAALRTALAQASQRPDAEVDELALLQAYRAVLDDAQRADLATLLRAAPLQAGGPPPGGGGPGLQLRTEGLGLSNDQQAKLDAFQAALGADGPGGRLNLIAVADYFETGDAATLDADASAAYPVDALIALAQALSATQRATLFAAGAPGLPGARPQPVGRQPDGRATNG